MSETTTSTGTADGATTETMTETTTGFKPIESQEDFDKAVADRLRRQKAQYAGHDEYRTKAEKYDQLEASQKTELEKAVDKAKAEGRTEAMSAANTRLVKAEARAMAAAAKFRDPADAVAFLDLSTITVDDDGDVNTKAIESALADLATAKPYLLAGDERAPSFQGGARTGGAAPSGPVEDFKRFLDQNLT